MARSPRSGANGDTHPSITCNELRNLEASRTGGHREPAEPGIQSGETLRERNGGANKMIPCRHS